MRALRCWLAAATPSWKRFTGVGLRFRHSLDRIGNPKGINHEGYEGPRRAMSRNVLLQLLGGTRSPAHLRRWINFWPPFLGAGIRITHIAPDVKAVDVEMNLRWWNANYVGTHFGGSLFAMTDAFYMLMLMANLGRDYIVWDKAASIRYRRPGRGKVRAEFRLIDAQLDDIREKLKTLPKYEAVLKVEVKDEQGIVIAEVEKVLHVRRKESAPGSDSGERTQSTA
jgi:acyl-coenzyme A thioesterase PaaI-like protein